MMLVLVTAASILAATPAIAQTTYRYVDPSGHAVYSDRPPPASATNAEARELTANVIDTDALPFATRDAMKRYPVTLYTFDCDVCKSAEALLAKRGVPHTTVIVSDAQGAAKLKALTGGQSAPVLQVGASEVAIGYNESRWQAILDGAGYPKDAPPLRPKAAPAAAAGPATPATAAAGGTTGSTAQGGTPAAPPQGAAAGAPSPSAASGTPAPTSRVPASGAPASGAPASGAPASGAPAVPSPGPGTGYPQ